MSSVMNPSISFSMPAHWRRPILGFALALLALLLLYRGTGLAMVSIWERSETFAHAFVVPPIALWLIWRRRGELASLQPRPCLWVLPLLVLSAFAWLLGELAAVNALTQLALVAMLVLLVPLLLGLHVTKLIVFPLAFLFFCVPIGEFLMPQLMETTADFTVAALRLTGIPVYREGQQFVIPTGNWSVVEACSGLRYLIASVMVGTLFAYLNYRSLRRRLVFVGVAIALPLVANWIRAYMIVMIGHLSGNELATGADHLIYGWVFFGVVMLLMFMVGARWSEPEFKTQAGAIGPIMAPKPGRSVWPAALLALVVLLVPLLLLRSFEHETVDRSVRLQAPVLKGWSGPGAAPNAWKPAFENPAGELQTGYTAAGRTVGLYLAYYRHQGYDSKIISSGNQLVQSRSKQWAEVDPTGVSATVGGRSLGLRSAELRSQLSSSLPQERWLVWRFYWINGELTASDARAKAWGALQRLIGRGDDAAAVVLYTPVVEGNTAMAAKTLQAFLQDNWAALQAQLEQTRAAP